MSQLFGPVHQMGYVVRNIEAAMRHWTQNMHIGPFYYAERVPYIGHVYRGEACPAEVSVALTYSGKVQIELIQQHDGTPSSYQRFTAAGHEGLHHIGFLTNHFEHDLQRASEAGLAIEQSAVVGNPEWKSAYFASRGHLGTVLKLIALHPGNRDLYHMVRTEAERWDGGGPVRRIEL